MAARGTVQRLPGAAARGVGRLGGYTPATDGPRPLAGQNVAGILLALVLYPVAVNLFLGGPGQAWGWVKAKWINEPYGSQPTAGSGNNTFGPGGINSGAPAPGSPIYTTVYRTAPLPSTSRSNPA